MERHWARETGPLGYPITDEKRAPDGVGRYNHFSGAGGASIYWSPTTRGALGDRGRPRQVGVAGLGDRTWLSDADTTARRTGWDGTTTSPVEVGTRSYWSPTTGAHFVLGAIRSKWAALGWETGPLRYPITDEKGTPDSVGRYNHFSGSGVDLLDAEDSGAPGDRCDPV